MLRIRNFIALIFISALLTGCGGGGGGTDSGSNPPPGGNNPPPPAGSKSINLNWTAPSARTDGSAVALSEIGGYKLFVGPEPGYYDETIDVGKSTSYTLNKSVGTYYIALAAYDTNAQDSAKSSEFTVTVN